VRGAWGRVRGGRRSQHRTGAAADARGMVLLTVMFVLFAVGMMLFGFMFLTQSALEFATLNRDSTVALGLAEAGAQESLARLAMVGAVPGTTAFINSLAGSGDCAAVPPLDCVRYQPAFQSDPAIVPVLSTATVAGARRAVRVVAQVKYKAGLGSVIYGPRVMFRGNAQPVGGDTYAQTSLEFQQYTASPRPAPGATPTNLVSPQVVAGSTIGVRAGGPGPFPYECGDGSLTEVAPTTCAGGGPSSEVHGRSLEAGAAGRAVDRTGSPLPVNWHPMTPVGMSAADFAAVVTWITANPSSAGPAGLAAAPATQNGAAVTYTPAGTYTPSYWPAGSTRGPVMLILASQRFCVDPASGQVQGPSPPSGACTPGWHAYAGGPTTLRYFDWGLVQDDLSRARAQTFFQAPTCAACAAGGPNGNPNGIRYVPLLPALDVLAHACRQNVGPGINVFDQLNAGDGIACADPPTRTISTADVTFSGTRTSPEVLVIDNAGQGPVRISGSLPGPGSCGSVFDGYNWGIILATGDLELEDNLALTGFVYTPGTITTRGTVVVHGGIFSANVQGDARSQVSRVDALGTVHFCPASTAALLLSPMFFDFSAISWQDRPLNQP
jgi:hypothetical protein